MKIRVSIVVPVYNVAQYLRACLGSVADQTLRDIEVICVDDGSTDKSGEILEEYAARDSRFVVVHQENKGVASARNRALDMARGEFVAFMDPDDMYPDERVLEDMVRGAEENGVDICGGGMVEVHGMPLEPEMTFASDGIVSYADYQFEYGFYRYLFRRSLLLSGNHRFPSLKRFQDVPFLVKAMHAAGRFYALKRPTYCYRLGHQAVDWAVDDSTRGVDNAIGMLATYDLANRFGYTEMVRRMRRRIYDFPKQLGCEIRGLREARVEMAAVQQNLEAARAALAAECDGLRSKAAALEGECARMNDEVCRLKRSESYRLGMFLTWPVRRALCACRKLRNVIKRCD